MRRSANGRVTLLTVIQVACIEPFEGYIFICKSYVGINWFRVISKTTEFDNTHADIRDPETSLNKRFEILFTRESLA